MRNLKRLSLNDDDPTMMASNVENSTSDTENGKQSFLVVSFLAILYLDDEPDNQ